MQTSQTEMEHDDQSSLVELSRKTTVSPPAECTPSWFDRFIEVAREHPVPQVSTLFLSSNRITAKKHEYKLMGALKFLGIIDAKGIPSARLEALRVVGDQYKKNLREVVESAYEDLLKVVSIRSTSQEGLYNYFISKVKFSRTQAEGASEFFVWIANQAGLELSPELLSILSQPNRDPFIIFAMLIMKENELKEAARKVKVIYRIPEKEDDILDALRSWGLFAKIIMKSSSGEYVVGITEEKLNEQYLKDLMQAIQSELTARLFVSAKVREYAYAYLGDEEKDGLVGALMKFGNQSEDAVREMGNSFETFLRRLGTDKGVANLSRSNGISDLASSLKGAIPAPPRTGTMILEQHRKLCDSIGVYRNAADHGIDKVTLKPWKIENDAALEAVLLSLTTMRSIFNYVEKGDQII